MMLYKLGRYNQLYESQLASSFLSPVLASLTYDSACPLLAGLKEDVCITLTPSDASVDVDFGQTNCLALSVNNSFGRKIWYTL